jgi:hypothetical protein
LRLGLEVVASRLITSTRRCRLAVARGGRVVRTGRGLALRRAVPVRLLA